jgi:hypothetical protein
MYNYLYLFLNAQPWKKPSQQRRRVFFVLLSTKEERKRGKQNGAESSYSCSDHQGTFDQSIL